MEGPPGPLGVLRLRQWPLSRTQANTEARTTIPGPYMETRRHTFCQCLSHHQKCWLLQSPIFALLSFQISLCPYASDIGFPNLPLKFLELCSIENKSPNIFNSHGVFSFHLPTQLKLGSFPRAQLPSPIGFRVWKRGQHFPPHKIAFPHYFSSTNIQQPGAMGLMSSNYITISTSFFFAIDQPSNHQPTYVNAFLPQHTVFSPCSPAIIPNVASVITWIMHPPVFPPVTFTLTWLQLLSPVDISKLGYHIEALHLQCPKGNMGQCGKFKL